METVVGNIKKNWHIPMLMLTTLCPSAWRATLCPSPGGWPLPPLVGNGRPVLIPWRLSGLELRNISTQLSKFPLAGHYHAKSVLQILHSLCGAFQANACSAAIPFLNPDEAPHERKHSTNLLQKQW